MDDMAGAMTIHGNVLIKDKVVQAAPPSNKFAVIHWVSLFVNGGADISVYDTSTREDAAGLRKKKGGSR